MFATATRIASQFTFPVITSFLQENGECKSSIATFVLLNSEGWALTAWHVIEGIQKIQLAHQQYLELVQKRIGIEQDARLKNGDRQRQLRENKIQPNAITKFATLWGQPPVTFVIAHGIPTVDLAVIKLQNFDVSQISTFPLLKDPTRDMVAGSSLCKLGFPFATVTPTIDDQTRAFVLPPDSFPIPHFPIDGIMTREVVVKLEDPGPYPLKYIETSTPGLMGQSGGPTYDVHGAIWAIQSQTQHYALGFGQNAAKSRASEHLQNQTLNVGWGVHSATIISLLNEKGISFRLSPN